MSTEDALERSVALVAQVRRMERERCAEELREMADEHQRHELKLVLRLAAAKLLGE